MTGMREMTWEKWYQKRRYILQTYNNKYCVMSEKQAMDQKAIDVKFYLPLEKPPAEAKRPKKDVTKEKETARKIVLKTKDQLKQVNILYNAQIESLKIKYENYKVVYSYLEFPQIIKDYYQNTYQLYDSLKSKNKRIYINTDTKCLIFSDKRKPRPNKTIIQSQQIIDDEAYVRSLSSGIIFELEQSTQIFSLIRGARRSFLAQHYVALGKEYLRQNLYSRAKENFHMAFEVYEQLHLGRTEQCAKIHYELGRLYIQQGEKVDPNEQENITLLKDYQQMAIEEFKSALGILSSIKNFNLAELKATILNSLGSAYSRSDPHQAKQYFREALSHTQLLDKSSNPCFEAYLNLGKLQNKLKDYNQAYKDLSQYQQMISLDRYDSKKTFKIDCQLQYACLGLKRYTQGLDIIIRMDSNQSRQRATINDIITKWGKVLTRINSRQIIQPLQTLQRILYAYCYQEDPSNDPRVFSIINKLDSLKGR